MKTLFFLFGCFTLQCGAATWYVDSIATGSANGTSWANAWTSPTNIAGVVAGDIVQISGGPSGTAQTYNLPGDVSWLPAGGTSGSRITYQIGQDSSHNGTAIFSGDGVAGHRFWFLDGGLNPDINLSGDAGDGQRHIALTNFYTAFSIPDITSVHLSYLSFVGTNLYEVLYTGGATATNFEMDHCYGMLTVTNADHWAYVQQCLGDWDSVFFHDNVALLPHAASGPGYGADGFQVNGSGFTLSNNVIGGFDLPNFITGVAAQHQDGWQGTGLSQKFKLVNNLITNIGNYGFYGDLVSGGFTNFIVANNRILVNNLIAGGFPAGIAFGPQGGTRFDTITIANNLCDGYTNNAGSPIRLADVDNTGVVFTNCTIANNVVLNDGPANQSLQTNNNLTTVQFGNVFTNAATATNWFNAYAFYTVNSDYHLTSAATALIGQATNLSTFFTFDADGVTRTVPWDIGPYKFINGGGGGSSSGPYTPFYRR